MPYIFLPLILLMGCINSGQKIIKVHERNSGSIHSISMAGNLLDFHINQDPKPFRCTLNAGIIITASDTYYTLNFSSMNLNLPFFLTNEDSFLVKIDNSRVHLPTLDVSRSGENFSAYYRINYLDLLDMGHADDLEVFFIHGDSTFHATFSETNINNYRYFNARYILKTDDIPEPLPKTYALPWGFLSGGAGATYDFWIGYYTDFILHGAKFSDFIAAGFGLSPFSYSEWERVPYPIPPSADITYQTDQKIHWHELNEDRSQSYNFHLMYGLAQYSPFRNWSVELGLAFFYYWSGPRWANGQDRYLSGDILTIVESGTPFSGPAIGGFLQIAGLWLQYNSKPSWTIGLALPLPWW